MHCNSSDMTDFFPDARQPADRKRVSLVIPMFNEGEALPALFARLDAVLPNLPAYQFEIVCVNDGSSDETLTLLQQLTATRRDVTLVDLSRNFGKEAALSAGLFVADGDAVIPLDADLQDPPEVIKELLAKWEEGFEVVLARRSDRSADTAAKRFTARSFYRIHNAVADVEIPSDVGDFRLMDRVVIDALNALPEGRRFMKGLFAWVGFRTATIDYKRESRVAGNSKFNAWKLWNFALEGIASFSISPLKVWTYIGVAVALAAMGWGGWIALRTLIWGVDLPGYASILVAVLFLGGLQLTGIGMIGEYLGRAFMESKRRPAYLIRQVVRGASPGQRPALPPAAPFVAPLRAPTAPSSFTRALRAVSGALTFTSDWLNQQRPATVIAVFLLLAVLLQWPVLFNPGYLSHDELQWLWYSHKSLNEIAGFGLFDVKQFQFRPVTFSLWLFVSHLFGESPIAMHIVRGGVGIVSAGMLSLLLCRLGASRQQSLVAGLLFLLTPMAVYTNSWIGTYADALCLFMFLCVALVLVRRTPSSLFTVAVVAFLATAVALLSKEAAIVFPALLGLGWLLRRQRALLTATVASGAAVLVYMLLRLEVILFPATRSDGYAWKLAYIPARIMEYALFPFSLNRFDSLWPIDRPLAWFAISLLVLVLMVAARLGWRWLCVLIVGFYAAIGPVMILSFSAAHYAFLATAFACGFFALGWKKLGVYSRSALLIATLVVVIHGGQMMRTVYRIGSIQNVLYNDIKRILPSMNGPINIRTADIWDSYIVYRLLFQVPEYLGMPLAGKVVAIQANDTTIEPTHIMERSGHLVPATPPTPPTQRP